MATSSSSSMANTATDNLGINSHEVSIAELSALPSSRKVYQKNGTIFFRTNVQQATASEQKWEVCDSNTGSVVATENTGSNVVGMENEDSDGDGTVNGGVGYSEVIV
ncbi:hypothetical protein Tco_0811017 [Tanacetum coccineum]